MPASHKTEYKIAGLDGLRGIACIGVFLVHFQQLSKVDAEYASFQLGRFLENGNTGVALFFVLSGFLLSLPFWNHVIYSGPRPSIATFWLRRLARIVPAYYLCLSALIVLNQYWLEDQSGWDMVLHYAFAYNYGERTIFSINPPFWTLAVEIQFYLLLPFLWMLVPRTNPFISASFVLLLAVVAYAAHLLMIRFSAGHGGGLLATSPVLQYSLLAHLPHFLIGVASGPIHLHLRKNLRRYLAWLAPLAESVVWASALLAFLILSTALGDLLELPHGRYNLPVVPLLLASILIFVPFSEAAKTILDSRPFRGLGLISYGVYLFHLPVQHAVVRYMKALAGLDATKNWVIFGASSLLATILVAWVSYLFLEKPIVSIVARLRQAAR